MSSSSLRSECRQHYRIQYPSALRPALCIGSTRLAVIDLSESGLRLAGSTASADTVGAAVEATLCFQDGEAVPIRGSVVRVTERDIALNLERGFSFHTMVREQRKLLEAAPYALH